MIIIYILAVIGAISLLGVVSMVFLLTICSMDDPDEKETHEKQWICALTNEHCIFTVERGTCNGCPILEEAEKIGNHIEWIKMERVTPTRPPEERGTA